MGWIISVMCILLLLVLNYDKVNEKIYNKPTLEELDTFQDSVLLHLKEEAELYEKKMKKHYEREYMPSVEKMDKMLEEIEIKKKELMDLEERIDKKIMRLNMLDKH